MHEQDSLVKMEIKHRKKLSIPGVYFYVGLHLRQRKKGISVVAL